MTASIKRSGRYFKFTIEDWEIKKKSLNHKGHKVNHTKSTKQNPKSIKRILRLLSGDAEGRAQALSAEAFKRRLRATEEEGVRGEM
jgi:hypothetical protein